MDKRRNRGQALRTVWATVQQPGGKRRNNKNKRGLVSMIKDVSVDWDKLQSNMSHKQTTECTSGQ